MDRMMVIIQFACCQQGKCIFLYVSHPTQPSAFFYCWNGPHIKIFQKICFHQEAKIGGWSHQKSMAHFWSTNSNMDRFSTPSTLWYKFHKIDRAKGLAMTPWGTSSMYITYFRGGGTKLASSFCFHFSMKMQSKFIMVALLG